MNGQYQFHDLAAKCARRHLTTLLNFDDRYDLAWEAIAEAHSAGERYDGALIRAGLHAIGDEHDAIIKHHGLPRAHDDRSTGGRYQVFWHGSLRLTAPFEEPVLEREALRQIWWALPEDDQELLAAVAWYDGDLLQVARSYNYTPQTIRTNLWRARARARRLWHDWEPAPDHYGGRHGPYRGTTPVSARRRAQVNEHRRERHRNE